jgi:hypothetical protein
MGLKESRSSGNSFLMRYSSLNVADECWKQNNFGCVRKDILPAVLCLPVFLITISLSKNMSVRPLR